MFVYLMLLSDYIAGIGVIKYITFRTVAAVVTSALFMFIFSPRLINLFKLQQGAGQPIRDDGPQTHFKKAGTPTMGGLIILLAMTVSSLLWANLDNKYVWLVLIITLLFGGIGFYDDYLKITNQHQRGLSGKLRLLFEAVLALVVAIIVYRSTGAQLVMPFFKDFVIPLGWFFFPFAALVIVGSANAVNFTDGLDGLAIAPAMIAASSFALIAYLCGNSIFANYLQIHYVSGAGELAVLLGAVVGAGLGFLWFNAPPAAIFMGDTGSLALGGMLGSIAVITHHELVWAIIGGVFVMEALSVIIQVGCYKLTKKRIFLMAPIHHHFEKKGWTESQIVIRFWIIALMLALIGLSTLKLR